MKSKKLWRVCLLWGVVLAVALALFELIKMAARTVDYGSTQMFDIALIVGYVVILHAGIKAFKAAYPDRLTFSKAFLCGLIISFVGSTLFFGYELLHYQVIEKDGLNKKYETALQNFRNVIDKDTITSEELNWYIDTVETILNQQKSNCLEKGSIPDSLKEDVMKGVDLIDKFFVEKISTQKSLDTANHYQMANFSTYGRKVMVETMVLYVDQNDNLPSTNYVKEILQQTNISLEKVNPADRRFNMTKSHVPHYEKPGRYAAFAAMMDLLYGMFFSIFVAMYHYRSKNTKEEEPTTTYPTNETESNEKTEN